MQADGACINPALNVSPNVASGGHRVLGKHHFKRPTGTHKEEEESEIAMIQSGIHIDTGIHLVPAWFMSRLHSQVQNASERRLQADLLTAARRRLCCDLQLIRQTKTPLLPNLQTLNHVIRLTKTPLLSILQTQHHVMHLMSVGTDIIHADVQRKHDDICCSEQTDCHQVSFY